MTLLGIDNLACEVADLLSQLEGVGYSVTRRPVVNVDPKQLPESYYCKFPDYRLIRKHLAEGIAVPGAELTVDCEYVLSLRDGG